MVGKKLLTAGCAVGILACGACFLPPLPESRSSPVRIDLTGVRTIRVEVVNQSETHHLDEADLASEVAGAITSRFGPRSHRPELRAYSGIGRGDADATLNITIEGEAQDEGQPLSGWFVIRDSSALTNRSGASLWQEKNVTNRAFLQVAPGGGADGWSQPLVSKRLDSILADRLVYRMLYLR